MTTFLLRDLRALGVSVAADDGTLVLDGPDHVLTDDVISMVQAAKEDILAALADKSGLPAHQQWAHHLNLMSDLVEPCPGWRAGCWRQSLEAALAFCDEHGQTAAELGWTDVELFGVDPHVGIARLDACGALMLGAG